MCDYINPLNGNKCQFGLSTLKDIEFSNKMWCKFHLPIDATDLRRGLSARDQYVRHLNDYLIDIIFNKTSANGVADFSGVVFPETFEVPHGSQIDVKIVFDNAQFLGGAIFKGCHFSDATSFEGASFIQGANFSRCKFSKCTNFSGAKFHERAEFKHSEFLEKAMFSEAEFYKSCNFREAHFFDYTYFFKSKFNEHAVFDGCICLATSRVIFLNSEFNSKVSFCKSEFRSYASFRGCKFHETTLFDGSRFYDHVIFEKSTFGGQSSFAKVQFYADFNFRNTAISNDCSFERVKFRSPFGRGRAESFRSIKRAMDGARNQSEMNRFAALEQRALLFSRDWLDISLLAHNLAATLYWIGSGFGRSIIRPIIILFVTGFIFSMIIYPRYIPDDKNCRMGYTPSVAFAISQVSQPFSILSVTTDKSKIDCGIGGALDTNPISIRIIATIQSIIHITLIALLILALRKHFKAE